ncbi:unnamed protein product [Lampetra planeri]
MPTGHRHGMSSFDDVAKGTWGQCSHALSPTDHDVYGYAAAVQTFICPLPHPRILSRSFPCLDQLLYIETNVLTEVYKMRAGAERVRCRDLAVAPVKLEVCEEAVADVPERSVGEPDSQTTDVLADRSCSM